MIHFMVAFLVSVAVTLYMGRELEKDHSLASFICFVIPLVSTLGCGYILTTF